MLFTFVLCLLCVLDYVMILNLLYMVGNSVVIMHLVVCLCVLFEFIVIVLVVFGFNLLCWYCVGFVGLFIVLWCSCLWG